jgi:hypothetical protein
MEKPQWPHPTNAEFNRKIRSIVNMYGCASPRDKELLIEIKSYLKSCVKNILEHKVKRDTEKFFELLNLKMDHSLGKTQEERQYAIYEADVLFFAGDWEDYEPCLEDFRYASVLQKPKFEIFHKPYMDLNEVVSYVDPIRPIEGTTWRNDLAKDILVYQEPSGKYEVIDGNHRYEFAARLGTVKTISGWVIRDV